MDDRQAVKRLKRGDIAGLSALMVRYQVRATRTAFLIMQDAALAEDVVQEAFVNVYRSIGSFDAARPFAPWFMRIVVNGALKAARRSEGQVPLDPLEDETELDYAERLIDPAPGPEDLLETAETEAALWAALGRLPAERRAVIVLKYYLELDDTQVAAQLSIPVGTVKSRLHFARRQLRALLKV